MEPQVTLTNPDKVLYPATGTTKQQVFDYYSAIAPYLLPHIKNRPITRRVWPNGVEQPMFYSKDTGKGTPDWIERVPIQHQNSLKEYPLINSKTALEWDAQTAGLEIHVPQWRVDNKGQPLPPDRLVIDLDPGEGVGLRECAKVAVLIKEIMQGMGLELYPCTSGSKGIHLYAPLKPKKGQKPYTSDQVSELAKELARHLEGDHPDLVVSTLSKAKRVGKVMVDWSQNNGKKTTITPYSLRGTKEPFAVAPRTWEEIESPNLKQLRFDEVLQRAHKYGDLLQGLLTAPSGAKPARSQNSGATVTSAKGTESAKRVKPVNGVTSEKTVTPVVSSNPDGTARPTASVELPSPMLAVMASQSELAMLEKDGHSANPKWRFELKWDGYRCLAVITEENGKPTLRLYSRNGLEFLDKYGHSRYPALNVLAEQVGQVFPVILDTEIVALKNRVPSFRDLQSYDPNTSTAELTIQIFDILQLGNRNLVNEPAAKRRELLEQVVSEKGPVHISPELPYEDAITISEHYKLEGVMAKRANAKYQPGVRSKDWLKIKHLQQGTYYIVGWKPYHAGEANENPNAIGSLLLARNTAPKTYQFVGRVGTGFTEKMRHELQATLKPLNTDKPPKGISGLSKAESTAAIWVKPKLEGKVEFAEWTLDDAEAPEARLRHPRWRGLAN